MFYFCNNRKNNSTSYCFKAGLFLLIWTLIISPTQIAFAVTDDFTVNLLVGVDTTPPTTPTLLSVDPVAPTQIDIAWSVSTDNILLSGYVLLRDSVPIATTTLTSYIDTNLLPETLYTYEVYAFDHAGNVSTTSNALATTTPAVPVPVVEDGQSTSEATIVFRLLELDIKTEANNALFSWRTSMPSNFVLRWGKSDSYDAGYISSNSFRANNKTLVNGLEPGTVYLYELIGYSASGVELVLRKGQFKTQGLQSYAPPNVANLIAKTSGNDVTLSWTMPPLADDFIVRVVRSYLGYPTDIYDGAVVYEGRANTFFDQGALQDYSTQYYTVFVVKTNGAVSSGAVAKASTIILSGNEVEEIFNQPEITFADYDFDIGNINIYQGNKSFNFNNETIALTADESFLISIPYDALPKNLKSIVVTIIDPTNPKRAYSFLLRINQDRTAYEATVAAFNLMGPSRVQIEVFDFERNISARYRKPVAFIKSETALEVIFPDKLVANAVTYFPYIVGLLALTAIFFFLIYKRQRRTEDNI